jgi:hypothetical protein
MDRYDELLALPREELERKARALHCYRETHNIKGLGSSHSADRMIETIQKFANDNNYPLNRLIVDIGENCDGDAQIEVIYYNVPPTNEELAHDIESTEKHYRSVISIMQEQLEEAK